MTIEARLKKTPYILGAEISLADISLACDLVWPLRTVFDTSYRKPMGNLVKWFTNISSLPEFQRVWGAVKLTTKAMSTPIL